MYNIDFLYRMWYNVEGVFLLEIGAYEIGALKFKRPDAPTPAR